MLISITSDNNLEIKFIDGPKFDTSLHYTSADKEISIGRMPECTIRFEESSLSRYQCTLYFED
jgi:hypothetical protein